MGKKIVSIPEELLDEYMKELETATCSYDMLGKMLDSDLMKRRLQLLSASKLYIYGGGYLGIQLYRMAGHYVDIPAIVDKSGRLVLNVDDIPVIFPKDFKNCYSGEKVIITSVKFYEEIKKELSLFVPEEQMVYIGEFLGGILS